MKDYSEADKAASKEFGTGMGRPIPQAEINLPEAFPGDVVWFENPRIKGWNLKFGTVVSVETTWESSGNYCHSYKIKPDLKKYTVTVNSIDQNATRVQGK